MAVSQGQRRASGVTGGEELAAQESRRMVEPVSTDGTIEQGLEGGPVGRRPEDIHTTLTPSFRRMRTDWLSPDRDTISQMRTAIDMVIQQRFWDWYELRYRIYDLVREREVGKVDEHGLPVWKRNADGGYVEDWSKVTGREREDWLYRITTAMSGWEETTANLWGEALFAKAHFEEAFSAGYEELDNPRATIEDRTARARMRAAEHRYFAVYKSYLSRRADMVVKSAERLGQRIKDLHVS